MLPVVKIKKSPLVEGHSYSQTDQGLRLGYQAWRECSVGSGEMEGSSRDANVYLCACVYVYGWNRKKERKRKAGASGGGFLWSCCCCSDVRACVTKYKGFPGPRALYTFLNVGREEKTEYTGGKRVISR